MNRRALFIANALTGPELTAGTRDCEKIYRVLSDDRYGGCDLSISLPILPDCPSAGEYVTRLMEFLALSKGAERIIYFTGHGKVGTGEVYGFLFGEEFLPFTAVTGLMQGQGAARALFILDTCRSGAATFGGVKDASMPLQAGGCAILFSSRAVQASHEDGERGSLFTHYLCECIVSGNGRRRTTNGLITLADAATYISRRIREDGDHYQNVGYKIEEAEGFSAIALNITGAIDHPEGGPRAPDELSEACFDAEIAELDSDLLLKYGRDNLGQQFNTAFEVVAALRLCPTSHPSVPSKAAMLCFGLTPSHYFPTAASTFSAGDLTDIRFVRQAVDGPLLMQLQTLVQMTSRELRTVSSIDRDSVRADTMEIPATLLREVIANALAHRDISAPGKVQVHVDDHFVTVTNPGGLPEGYTWSGMLDNPGTTLTPNPRLANLLQKVGGHDGVGRGFSMLHKYRKQWGIDAVKFEQTGRSVVCKLRRPQKAAFATELGVPVHERRIRQFTTERAAALAQVSDPMSRTRQDVLEIPLIKRDAAMLKQLGDDVTSPGAVIILEGAAGSGKTWMLRRLYAILSETLVTETDSQVGSPRSIPIYAELRRLVPGLPLAAAISSAIGADPAFFEYIFERHHPILLLDGLDECTPGAQSLLIEAIRTARSNHPQLTILISSRPYSARVVMGDEQNRFLGPLSKADAAEFIRLAVPGSVAEDAKSRLLDFDSWVLDSPLLLRMAINALAVNPVLPGSLDALLTVAVDTLLGLHDASKAGYFRTRRSGLDRHQERRVIEGFALSLTLSQYWSPDRATAIGLMNNALRLTGVESMTGVPIRAEEVLDDFVDTGLLGSDGGAVAFVHRAMLEHFTLDAVARWELSIEGLVRIVAALMDQQVDVDRIVRAVGSRPTLPGERSGLEAGLRERVATARGLAPSFEELLEKINAQAAAREKQQEAASDLLDLTAGPPQRSG